MHCFPTTEHIDVARLHCTELNVLLEADVRTHCPLLRETLRRFAVVENNATLLFLFWKIQKVYINVVCSLLF